MEVHVVYCEFYQDKEIEKIFLSKSEADKYADEQNKKYEGDNAWYVWAYDVEEGENK